MNPVYIKLGMRKLIWARSKAKKGSGSRSGCLDQDPSSSPDPHQTSPLGTEEKRLELLALLPPRPQPSCSTLGVRSTTVGAVFGQTV